MELLITVTPELISPLDAHQVSPGGPGLNSTTPSSKALFCHGHLEVPYRCWGPAETVVPNTAYDQFLPGVYRNQTSDEAVHPSAPFKAEPVVPEPVPADVKTYDLGSPNLSFRSQSDVFLPDASDGFIGPVGYESDPAN